MSSSPSGGRCPNCGAELSGPFCAACGQRQADLDRPFTELVVEGLATFLSFDTRLVRTLWPLIRRPGFLTTEYLDGRRARFVQPFKLYFVFSLIFFFVFSMSGYSLIRVDEPAVVLITTDEAVEAASGGDGDRESPSGDADDSSWLSVLFAPLVEIAANDPDRLNRLFLDRLSTSLIILVPVVALLLQLLYWKPRYVAHFVFALHLHSFSFMILLLGAVADAAARLAGFAGEGAVNEIAMAGILVYTYLALRRVHGQGRLVTLGKLAVLMLGYAFSLVMTMLGTLVATVVGM